MNEDFCECGRRYYKLGHARLACECISKKSETLLRLRKMFPSYKKVTITGQVKYAGEVPWEPDLNILALYLLTGPKES